MLKGLITAFSMYSKIPMPRIEWSEDSMRYSLCFFPLVGAIIGITLILWGKVCFLFNIPDLLFCAVCTALPILISGGIHLDGFIDTSDAFSSYKSREEKLGILKDPHVGAFGIICCCVYFILTFGSFQAAYDMEKLEIIALCFVLSRALSALNISKEKCAKDSGLLFMFSSAAHKRVVAISSGIYIAVCVGLMYIISEKTALCVSAAYLVVEAYYLYKTKKEFGGITGDTAGWLVCVEELVMIAVIALVG